MMTSILSKEQLAELIPGNTYLDQWYDSLIKVLPDYEIDTTLRVAAFIAQTCHESSNYTKLHENLNYRAESLMRTWPARFPTSAIADKYAHNQEAIANYVYADRMGNGSERSGDGWKFRGRGLIQLTGRENYQVFATSIGKSVEEIPEYLETFEGAITGACWFWKRRSLNECADRSDMITLTKKINGGTTGLDERIKNYNHALQVLME